MENIFSFLKLIFFILTIFAFGYSFLSQILKIKSILILIPLSVSFGVSMCIFLCHILSYIFGPQAASLISIFILFAIALIIIIAEHKTILEIQTDIKKNYLISILVIALFISFLVFLCVFRYGVLDKEYHVPLAFTLYHNNVYPPRDLFRPEYLLLYHFGGDLFATTIYSFCKFDMFRSFEIISTIFSGTTFLSYLALAWLLTKNYKTSLLAGFCTYFGGGLLWLDAIVRYLFKILPEEWRYWGFTQTFLSLGIHGGIINPP